MRRPARQLTVAQGSDEVCAELLTSTIAGTSTTPPVVPEIRVPVSGRSCPGELGRQDQSSASRTTTSTDIASKALLIPEKLPATGI